MIRVGSKLITGIVVLLLCVCQFFALLHTGEFIYKADFINLSVIFFSATIIILLGYKKRLNFAIIKNYHNSQKKKNRNSYNIGKGDNKT